VPKLSVKSLAARLARQRDVGRSAVVFPGPEVGDLDDSVQEMRTSAVRGHSRVLTIAQTALPSYL
jgi:hypothetical protein